MVTFRDLEEGDCFVLISGEDAAATLYRKDGKTANVYNRDGHIRNGALQLYPDPGNSLSPQPNQPVFKLNVTDERD